ncbi:ribonuclease H-like domain-containing protein [Tanacetum coccineum]
MQLFLQHPISNIKLLILKKEEYDIWAMEMEHYLEYIDNDVWKVIQNGNSKKRISTGKDGVIRVLSPVSAAEIHAEAIRTRFGGNANSKKMQKAVLKQQFEAFTISSSEGLEKGYDRFQQLLSQLEAHGAEVSTEDANHKFLRSLPPAWSNLAMTMRTKPDVDTLSIDDLYNNLRVFEQELTSTSKSSAKREVPAGFADEVIYSLFVKQSEDLDLLHEDLEQIDDLDIEEMDINWQIAMIAIRMKKFYKKTGRRVRIDGNKPVGFDKKKLECFKCHNTGHFARECTSKGTNDGKKRDSFYQDQGARKEREIGALLLRSQQIIIEGTLDQTPIDHPLKNMEDIGIFNSGCSRHMTGNKDHLDDFEECKGGSVTFGGSKGYITGKGRIRQHKVLFTETECLVVSPDFKMPDENQILLKVPRQHNMYSFDMKTPAPTKDYACLIAKATSDESKLWHRRSIMKDKSEDFETPTQGKTSGEADISPEGLEAAKTLAKVLTQRTKTYTRKVKTGLRRKLDADEVNTGEGINTGFTDVNTAFEEIKSGDDESKRTKKQIREEQASLAEIVRLQAQEEAENARKAELQRQDALITKRVQDELELSETQKNRMAQVHEAAKYYTEEDWDSVRAKLDANRDLSSKVLSIDFSSDDFAKKMVELINEKKRLYKE